MAKKDDKKSQPLYTQGLDKLNGHCFPEEQMVVSGRTTPVSFSTAEYGKLKSGFNRHDRHVHRPESTLPRGTADIIALCQSVYKKVGMIRNVIDLMADFAGEGLKLNHPIKKQERFYRKWAEKVDLQCRAHDFMKLLLRDANVIIRRKMATIPSSVQTEMTKAVSDVEHTSIIDIPKKEKPEKFPKTEKMTTNKVVPFKYVFLSPVNIEKIGGEIGRFFGSNRIAMRIPQALAKDIKNPHNDYEKELLSKMPSEIKEAAKKGRGSLVALKPEFIYIDYYKKDDWEDWGTPFLYGVMEDVLLKEKMKLADAAALDGVIDHTRIWKLGDHKEKIFPSLNAVNRLIDLLQHGVGGGVRDIVWDSMIDLVSEYPPIDKILGDEKYKAVNRDIMKGIGVPEALVGGMDLATRNAETAFVQLKTLIERLEYVRGRCIKWINNELTLVSQAMGWKNIPLVSFETMSLRDEAAEKQLLIQLADRGLISIQTINEVFGNNFVIELERMREEQKIREEDPTLLERANPYYRPESLIELQHQFKMELEKLRLSDKSGDESDRGGDNPGGDQPRDDGDNPPGRPPNTVDTNPRDQRTEKTLSVNKIVADRFLEDIDKIIDPLYLKTHQAKNIRSLNKQQVLQLEEIKRAILATIQPSDQITHDLISLRANDDSKGLVDIFETTFHQLVVKHAKMLNRHPTMAEKRSLATSTWAILINQWE
jgi:hypothetical protein